MTTFKERIKNDKRPGDHILWYGICRRCGAKRYLFLDELKWRGHNVHEDMYGKTVECKGGRCRVQVKLIGKQEPFRACHLNDIRRRGNRLNYEV